MKKSESKDENNTNSDIKDILVLIADIQKNIAVDHLQYIRDVAQKEYYQYYVAQTAKYFDNAAKYATIVIFGAYAAFFTIWANVHGQGIDKCALLISALLMGLSVLIFCSFEIWKMVVSARNCVGREDALKKAGDALMSGNYGETRSALDEAETIERLRESTMAKWWEWILYSCIATGVGGVIVFVWASVKSLHW
jgi:hypothetical protein